MVAAPKRRGLLSNDKEVIYLLHFARPIGNENNNRGRAQHYIGRCQGDRLDARMAEHRAGGASNITAAFHRAGIPFEQARLFRPVPGQRGVDLEKAMKARKDAPSLCPICNPGAGKVTTQRYESGEDQTP